MDPINPSQQMESSSNTKSGSSKMLLISLILLLMVSIGFNVYLFWKVNQQPTLLPNNVDLPITQQKITEPTPTQTSKLEISSPQLETTKDGSIVKMTTPFYLSFKLPPGYNIYPNLTNIVICHEANQDKDRKLEVRWEPLKDETENTLGYLSMLGAGECTSLTPAKINETVLFNKKIYQVEQENDQSGCMVKVDKSTITKAWVGKILDESNQPYLVSIFNLSQDTQSQSLLESFIYGKNVETAVGLDDIK